MLNLPSKENIILELEAIAEAKGTLAADVAFAKALIFLLKRAQN